MIIVLVLMLVKMGSIYSCCSVSLHCKIYLLHVKTIKLGYCIEMPPIRRSTLGRRTRNAANQRIFRSNRTEEQREERNEIERNRLSQIRSAHNTQEERENENEDSMHPMIHHRSVETNRATMNLNNRVRRQTNVTLNTHRAAFRYNAAIDYSADQAVAIGSMSVICPHCKALKYRNETPGLCCASRKVKLAPLVPPPEPLHSLVSGTGTDSTHFFEKNPAIQQLLPNDIVWRNKCGSGQFYAQF